jgi:hypothetical protein
MKVYFVGLVARLRVEVAFWDTPIALLALLSSKSKIMSNAIDDIHTTFIYNTDSNNVYTLEELPLVFDDL